MKYIINFFKSLGSIGSKDFFYLLIIVVMLITYVIRIPHVAKIEGKTPELVATQSYTDPLGIKHEVIEQKIYSKKDFENITDSLKKSLKANIRSVTTTVTKVDTVYQKVPIFIQGDSIITEVNNKDLNVKVVTDTSTKLSTVDIHLTPDTCTFVTTVHKRLFKTDLYQVDVKHSNSLFNTTMGNSFTYSEPKVNFSLGVGVGYNIITNKPYIGIGIQCNILNIKSRK